MLDPKRTAIIFKANDLQVAQADLFIRSLRDPDKGNFQGDLWVVSTGLSNDARCFLEANDIHYIVNSMPEFETWPHKAAVAKAQPMYADLMRKGQETPGRCLTLAFNSYRNKRMHELVVVDWVEMVGNRYDFIALCDCDMYVQSNIHALFTQCWESDSELFYYAAEEYEILPGSPLWRKDFHYLRLTPAQSIDFGRHEINIGLVIGRPRTLHRVFQLAKSYYWTLPGELFSRYSWHDQDLVRLIRAQHPEWFKEYADGSVVHMCNGGQTTIEERHAMDFIHNRTQKRPIVVHFAGGAWKNIPSVKPQYEIKWNEYVIRNMHRCVLDKKRTLSSWNIFNCVSEVMSEETLTKRIKTRSSWCNIKNGSSKKTLLYMTAFDAGTHKSLWDCIGSMFNSKSYDIIIANENYNQKHYDDILCEDIPEVVAHMTRLIGHAGLCNRFGIVDPNVDESCLTGCIESFICEYKCDVTAARALANIAYYYFNELYSFYKPDVICGYAYVPVFRVAYALAKKRGIPYAAMDWGVLGGSYSFDFSGCMGGSWVARYPEHFNALPLETADLEYADTYIQNYKINGFNRNKTQEALPAEVNLLTNLKQEGNHLVLLIGSNDAQSGNVPFDGPESSLHTPFYKTNAELFYAIAKSCKDIGKCITIYKPHPVALTRGLDISVLPPDTYVITGLALKTAIELCDVSVSNVSQGVYESLLLDKPVVMTGKNQINGSGAVYRLNRADELSAVLTEALSQGYTAEQQARFREHVARLMRYYLFSFTDPAAPHRIEELFDVLATVEEGKALPHYAPEMEACRTFRAGKEPVGKSLDLSIVIPVYNAEKYLPTCLASIVNQTRTCREVLCVDNGSTDASAEIIRYFAKRYSFIRLIQLDVPSAPAARNAGIRAASGKYLYVMDADDFLDANCLDRIGAVMETYDPEVLYFGYREILPKNVYIPSRWNYLCQFIGEGNISRIAKKDYKYLLTIPYPFSRVYNTEFIKTNSIYYDESCKFGDDNVHNILTLSSTNNIYMLKECLYNYCANSDSITKKKNSNIKYMIQSIDIMNKILTKKNLYSNFQEIFVPLKVQLLAWSWTVLPDEDKESYFDSIKVLIYDQDKLFMTTDIVKYGSLFRYEYFRFMEEMLHMTYKEYKQINARKAIFRKYKACKAVLRKLWTLGGKK